MKRYKVKDRKTGFKRFPNRDLYERYGLYQTPIVAGWRSAHACSLLYPFCPEEPFNWKKFWHYPEPSFLDEVFNFDSDG